MKHTRKSEPEERYEVISVYVPTELKRRAEIAAKRQGRKLSQYIRWCVELEVNEDMARWERTEERGAPRRHVAKPRHAGEGPIGIKLKPGLFEE